MNNIKLLKGTAPFYYAGGDVGCLLVHGFTGTPLEMRWLGQHLQQQGYTVYGPRLAGHATTPYDLARVSWREWCADVLAGYEMLRARCRVVFAMGLSMGGALSLLLASREAVDGVVAMSTPLEIKDWRTPLFPLLGLFVKVVSKGYPPPQEDPFQQRVLAEQRRRGEEPIGHISYREWVVPAVQQLLKMLHEVRRGLPRVTAPALLIHSQADNVVPLENLYRIHERIGSQEKDIVILQHSDHCVTEDAEHPAVFEAITHFVVRHS